MESILSVSRHSRLLVGYPGPLLGVLLALGGGACAEVPAAREADPGSRGASPKINAYYKDADVERWRKVFESPGREVFDRRMEISKAIGVTPGMRVADVGAGTGFFTMLFARAVGSDGKVYALDISEGFIAAIERRAAEYGLDNVQTIINDQKDTRLPADSLDLVFLCDTYHHFEHPQAMLASLARALKADGELVLIDFRRIPGVSSPWVTSHVRANKEQITKELQEAGFELVQDLNLLRENYFLRFRKAPRSGALPRPIGQD